MLDSVLGDLLLLISRVGGWPGVVVVLARDGDIAVDILCSSLYHHCPSGGDIVADLDEGIRTVEMIVGIDTADSVAVDVVDTLGEGTGDNMPLVGEEDMPTVDIEDGHNETMPNGYSSLYR